MMNVMTVDTMKMVVGDGDEKQRKEVGNNWI